MHYLNDDILVSVIIPTYNRAHTITETINSVLSQTYKNLEIIIIDDGSTDQTKKILQPYVSKIEYIYQVNKGVSAARNTGIKVASGDWVAFLDSDDQWLPDKIQRQIAIINSSRVELGCIICNMKFEPSAGKITNSFQNAPFSPSHPQGICFNMSSILLTRFILFNQGAIVKKEHLDKIGGYDEQLEILEDYDLALKLSFLCTWGFDTTPLVIYQRDTENSLSSKVDSNHETQIQLQILENLKLFLIDSSIPIPKLLNKRIKYFTIRKKSACLPFVELIFKIYRFLALRSAKFPRPNCTELPIN